jgi:hypothetical protein
MFGIILPLHRLEIIKVLDRPIVHGPEGNLQRLPEGRKQYSTATET